MERLHSWHRSASRLAVAAIVGTAAIAPAQVEGSVVRSDHYRARFEPDSFLFEPRASDAPDGYDGAALRLTLTSVARREPGAATRANRAALARPQRVLRGRYARYLRPGFVERYQPTVAGVELSFVFDRLPPGRGDLVATFRVATELVAESQGAPAPHLRFGAPDGSGVRIGAVTGIDANGRTSPGSMRFEHGELELVLPASFVETAALPLVLDPLIGTIYSPSTPANTDSHADAAYDETSDVFLVVFQRTFPRAPTEVIGQLVRPDGTPVGAAFGIAVGQFPEVGNAHASAAFAVVYERDKNLYTRTVFAATGRMSAEVVCTGGGGSRLELLDVGNNSSPTDDRVPVVYRGEGGSQTMPATGQVLTVPPTGRPQPGGIFFVATNSYVFTESHNFDASITEYRDLPGHYLITYDEWIGSAAFTPYERWLALDDLSSPPFQGLAMTVPDRSAGIHEGVIEGDGSEFLLAYSSVARRVRVAAGTLEFEPEINLGYRARDLARLDHSYLVSRDGQTVVSIDPWSCTPCEGVFSVTSGAQPGRAAAVARRTRNGRPVDEGLVVFEHKDPSRGGWIETQAFRTDDGHVTDLGGGCAPGGRAFVSCARTGNAHFAQELRDAAPSTPVWLLLGARSFQLPCGPCSLVVDPAGAVVGFAGSTDARGRASAALPLPNVPSLVGLKLVEQWLVAAQAGCPLGFAFSNGLEIELQ